MPLMIIRRRRIIIMIFILIIEQARGVGGWNGVRNKAAI